MLTKNNSNLNNCKMKNSGIKNEKIQWFLDQIKTDGQLMIYRGQDEIFGDKPLPKLDRCMQQMNINDEREKIKYLQEMLNEFKNMSYQYLGYHEPKNDWEWLSLAQHHGLPTCFLDWSDNPITALYFCVRDDSKFDKDGIIYRHNPNTAESYILKPLDLEEASSLHEIFRLEGHVIYPRHISRRITAQAALFTIDNTTPNKESIIIPKDDKKYLKEYLYDIGFNESTIFPEFDGVSNYIKWKLLNRQIVID